MKPAKTQRRRIIAPLVLALLTAASHAQLLVDFNRSDQIGGPTPQSGYQSFDGDHENTSDLTTQRSWSAFGTTVSLDVAWPDTISRRVKEATDRDSSDDAYWIGDKIDLITDWIGVDTRTSNGGNGNYDGTTGTPTTMTFRIGNLPASSYHWRSYHHDTENVHTPFLIDLSVDGGSNYTPIAGPLANGAFQMTDSSPGGIPASSQTYSGFPDPDPADLPSTVDFDLTTTAGQDVVIRFTPLSDPAGVHLQLFGVNGFELTESALPSVVNDPATDILPTSATIGGTITATGGSTPDVTIYWGEHDGGSDAQSWDASVSLGAQSASFSAALSDLSPSTTYHYRCLATTTVGPAWAASSTTFVTAAPATPPAIITQPATNITFTQADVNGEVTDSGGEPPQVTLYYGTSDGGSDPGAWQQSTALGTQSGAISNTLINLEFGVTYFFCFEAANSGGTAWTAPASFTTLSYDPAAVATGTAVNVTGNSAQVTGEVTDTGNDAPDITIYYGESDGGTNPLGWDLSVSLGTRSGAFATLLDNLAPLTTYYYRVFASNLGGDTWAPTTESFTTAESFNLLISEIMASNDSTVVPGSIPGTFEDWIEIHNAGPDPLDLGGWHLTDDSLDLAMWTFPLGTVIPSGGYLVVFASNEDTVDANGFFHTNFKLTASGDWVALVNPSLSIASQFGPDLADYPPQYDDVSYGTHPADATSVYFSAPTPGAANDSAGIMRVADTTFAPDRGYYQNAQSVTISTLTPGATIWYTTDGQPPVDDLGNPTPTANAYSAPIPVSTATVVRAAATLTGWQATNIDTHTYVVLDIDGANADGTDTAGHNTPFLEQAQPAGWGSLASGDFNMDQAITKSAAPSAGHEGLSEAQALLQGLRDIPTISIALDKDDFSGPDGIYSNPLSEDPPDTPSEDLVWERVCSAEFLPATGTLRFRHKRNAIYGTRRAIRKSRYRAPRVHMWRRPIRPSTTGANASVFQWQSCFFSLFRTCIQRSPPFLITVIWCGTPFLNKPVSK